MVYSIENIIVIISILYIFISSRKPSIILVKLFGLELLCSGIINLGSFIAISSFSISVSDFLQIIQIPFSLLVVISNIRIEKKKINALLIFIIAVVVSLMMVYFHPYEELVRTFDALDRYSTDQLSQYYHFVSIDTQVLKTTVRLISFAFNAFAISLIISLTEWTKLKRILFNFASVMIIFCWIEFITVNFIGSTALDYFYKIVFGTVPNHSIIRNGLRVVCGFTSEPSQLAMICFNILLLYILGNGKNTVSQRQHFLIQTAFIIPLLSGSFRFVGLLPILLVIIQIKSGFSIKNIFLTVMISLALLIVYYFGVADFFIQRLDGVISFLKTGNVNIYDGESGRLKTIIDAFSIFIHRPLFGIGPGTTFAYGFIPSILVMIGLNGTIAWYNLLFWSIGNIRRCEKTKRAYLILIIISFAWIYTNAISTGYSVMTLAIALEYATGLHFVDTKKNGITI